METPGRSVPIRMRGCSVPSRLERAATRPRRTPPAGGNLAVQRDIYEALAAGSHSGSLSNLSKYLDDECRKIEQYFAEVKQRKW